MEDDSSSKNTVITLPVEIGSCVYYVDDFTESIELCKVYGFQVLAHGKVQLMLKSDECKFVTSKWYRTQAEAKRALLRKLCDSAQAEGAKLFAAKLKERFDVANCVVTIDKEDIDNLLMEMISDGYLQ